MRSGELPKYEINSGSVFCACTQSQVLAALSQIAGAGGVRGSVAVDSAATPHVVTSDAPGNNFYFCDLINGAFSTKNYDSSALFNSPQFGSPHIEIDAADIILSSMQIGSEIGAAKAVT